MEYGEIRYRDWKKYRNLIFNLHESDIFYPFLSVHFHQLMIAGIICRAASVWMIGVDFGPYSPISFRQSMYLVQANKSIRPNPPVYPCCHQQPCLLTKDEHFLSSNITGLLSPHQKYTDSNTNGTEKRHRGRNRRLKWSNRPNN